MWTQCADDLLACACKGNSFFTKLQSPRHGRGQICYSGLHFVCCPIRYSETKINLIYFVFLSAFTIFAAQTKGIMQPSANKTSQVKWKGKIYGLAAILMCAIMLTGCDRTTLRRAIDLLGHRDESKPPIYHEYEGYSPGIRRSRVAEEFSRYHYYIAPESIAPDPDPDIYFRQDFEGVEPMVTFDEEQYWRDHPLQLDIDEENE